MSNKLRRKRVLKPEKYERKSALNRVIRNKKLEDDCFVEVFYSLQYISYTALWTADEDGGCGFSVEEIKRFYERLGFKKESESIKKLNMIVKYKYQCYPNITCLLSFC